MKSFRISIEGSTVVQIADCFVVSYKTKFLSYVPLHIGRISFESGDEEISTKLSES